MSHYICAASLVPICLECLCPIQWQVDPSCDAICVISLLFLRLWQSFHHCVLMQSSFIFFITLCTLRKSVLQTPVYHGHQNGKCMSVSLSSISIPNYIDYTSIAFQFAQRFVGPAFSVQFVNCLADSLLLCIPFRVKEHFIFIPAVKNQACFVCLSMGLLEFALFAVPRNFAVQ